MIRLFCLMLLAFPVCLEAAPPIPPASASVTVSYTMSPSWWWGPQPVWEVPNGTTVSQFGFQADVNSTNGFARLTGGLSPMPGSAVSTEWNSDGQYLATPFSRMPVTGSLDNDTHYAVAFSADPQGGGLNSAWSGWIIVGKPKASTLSLNASFSGLGVTDGDSFDVPVNTAVSVWTPSFTATNSNGGLVGMRTTISNVGSTGMIESEFSTSGVSQGPITRPTAAPSGVFNTAGQHVFRVLAHDGVMAKSYVLEFTVNVLAPQMEVQDGMGTISNDEATGGERDFGAVARGLLPSAWRTITVTNHGQGDLLLGTPMLFSGDINDFEIDYTGTANVLAPAASTTFGYRFAAGSAGVKQARISLPTNDPIEYPTFVINLAGEAVDAPLVRVADSAGPIAPGGSHDFGTVDVLAMPTAYSIITVANAGTSMLTLGTPALSGTNASSFVLDLSSFSTSIGAGSSTSFGVAFDAATIGAKSASLSFTHDDTTAANPFTIALSGVATSASQPVLTTTSLPDAVISTPYGPFVLTASGGVGGYAFVVAGGALPAGLTLDAAGNLSGTPTSAGAFNFDVRVNDSVGSHSTSPLSLMVQGGAGGSGAGATAGSGAGGCAAGAGALLPLLAPLLLLYRRRR